MKYRDFAWVMEEFPAIGHSVFVTYVRDCDPKAVINAMTDEYVGVADGLMAGLWGFAEREDDGADKGFNALVGAASIDEWTVALSPYGYSGLDEDKMSRLSVGRQVLTHSIDVEAHASFFVWEDGRRTAYFDPLLLCGFGLDPMPAEWAPRMQEVGIDLESSRAFDDDEYHVVEASLAAAANYLGVVITPDFLRNARFTFGICTYP